MPRPTDRVALGFIAAAIGFAVIHGTTNWISAWTPNLGASCLEIAATIAIVDRIIRREADRRIQPRRQRAQDEIGHGFLSLITAIGADYLETHDANERIPRDARAVIAQWRGGQAAEVRPRALPGGIPRLVRAAVLSAPLVESTVRYDRELIDGALVVAVDDLAASFRNIEYLWELVREHNPEREASEHAARMVVDAVEAFLDVYAETEDARVQLEPIDEHALAGAAIFLRAHGRN